MVAHKAAPGLPSGNGSGGHLEIPWHIRPHHAGVFFGGKQLLEQLNAAVHDLIMSAKSSSHELKQMLEDDQDYFNKLSKGVSLQSDESLTHPAVADC